MKKIEHLDKYVILPNVGFYGGFIYNGKDIFLCEDHDTDEGYDFKVRQEIKNDILITDMERKYTMKSGKWVTEKNHQEVELEKDQLLTYVEGVGYTIPEYRMCKIDEAIDQYNILKG